MLKPKFNKPLTRAERREQERTERRAMRRQTIEDVTAGLMLHRYTEQVELHAANNLPVGHPDNERRMKRTFEPLEQMLDDIEQTGEIEVGNDGKPILKPKWSMHHMNLVPALRNMAATFELVAQYQAVEPQTAGVRRLAQKWDVGMLLFQSDIEAARADLKWMREILAPLTPEQFSEYSIAINAREEWERIEREGRQNRKAS